MAAAEQQPAPLLVFPSWLQALRPALMGLSEPVYLVGGIVRDIVRGEEGHDLDLAVARRGMRTAYKLGNALAAPAYALDKARDVGRVVLPTSTIDIARFRGETLVADLLDRDFTINAMALPATGERLADVVDPAGGLADLAAGIIRQVSAAAIPNDPIRALRAMRLALQMQFIIEPETWASIQAAGASLMASSAERRRDELVTALLLPAPSAFLALLAESGLAPLLLPPLQATTAPLLATLARIETACSPAQPEAVAELPEFSAEAQVLLGAHWERPVDGGVTGRLLLRLAALCQHLTPAQTEQWLRDYRFSNELCRHVRLVVAEQERLSALMPATRLDERRIYRFFKGVGAAGLDIIALTLAQQMAAANPELPTLARLASQLAHAFQHHFTTSIAPPPLLRGDELMQIFALQPGPRVGELLARLEEEQAAGIVRTKDEALQFLSTLLHS